MRSKVWKTQLIRLIYQSLLFKEKMPMKIKLKRSPCCSIRIKKIQMSWEDGQNWSMRNSSKVSLLLNSSHLYFPNSSKSTITERYIPSFCTL